MKIDRHNYEEFFVLYWDNELPVAQKQAVEDFVKENPDLQEEFNLFGETHLIPDNGIRFEEKGFLLNGSFINITNYETQLLNYIDGELTGEQKKEVEKAASIYPAIEKELSLLQRTKLQPELSVGFPDKATLYRRGAPAKVINITWFRVAVAAAIIVIAGLVTFRLVGTDNSGDKNEIVNNTDGNKPEQTTTPSDVQSSALPGKEDRNLASEDQRSSTEKKSIEKKTEKTVVEGKLTGHDIAVNTSGNKNGLPIEGSGEFIAGENPKAETVMAGVEFPTIGKKDYNSPEKTETGVIDTSPDVSDVTNKPALALYIPEAEEKEKGGLKEFLRKTTRVFERRTKIQTTTEDNKLLVGAFAVSLK